MITKFRNKKLLIFVDQTLVSGSNFILGILLARYLGVEGYGRFALIWLIVLFFSSLQIACIISPMLTLGSKKSLLVLDKYLTSMISMQFLFTLLSAVCLYAFFEIAVYFDEQWNIGDLKLYVIATTILFLFQDFVRRYFIIKLQYFKLIFVDSIAYLGQLVGTIYFIYTDNLELKSVLLVISLSFGLSFLLGYPQIKKISTTVVHKKLLFLRNWQFSKWLILTSVTEWGSGNMYIIIGSFFLGSWVAGLIRIMQNVMGIFHVIFIALDTFLSMKISIIYKKKGYSITYSIMQKYALYGLFAFFMFVVFGFLFDKKIINYLYGAEYQNYAYLLSWFILIYLFIFLSLLLKIFLRAIEQTKLIFQATFLVTIFNLIIILPLIKIFGLDGVVVGILISNIVYVIYINNKLKRLELF